MAQAVAARNKQLHKDKKRSKLWYSAASIVAGLVVFCTVYALILPAITLEEQTFCGKEEHTEHSVEAGCYEERRTLICDLSEEGHLHDESCYERQQVLVCTLEESEGHTHDESCWGTERVLACGQEECAPHIHSEECMQKIRELVCTLEEGEDHTHSEDCYSTRYEAACGLQETEGHSHSELCYEDRAALLCRLEESEAHRHTEECFEEQLDLVCSLEEAAHHQHEDSCWQTEEVLICEKELHTHDLACFSDPSADLENESDWTSSFSQLELTGNWNADILAIAKTQLGYTESVKNYQVENGTLYGITRYGQWYGIPYGDWCAMYASFCIRYAQVDPEQMPVSAACADWVAQLGEAYHSAGSYTPEPGDIIFFDYDQDLVPDHVGIVAELKLNEDGSVETIRTIEGNRGDAVAYAEYAMDDASIAGFGEIPENPNYVPPMNYVEELSYSRDGWSVRISCMDEATIPEGAELRMARYAEGTAEYQTRYEEIAAFCSWEEGSSHANEFLTFGMAAYLQGEEIQLKGSYLVTLTIDQPVEGPQDWLVLQHTEEEELLYTETSFEGTARISEFEAETIGDFSVFAMPQLELSTMALDSDEEDLIAYFSFENGSLTDNDHNAKATASATLTEWGYSTVAPANNSQRSLKLTGDNLQKYLTVTKKDGSSLLTGYDEISLDFWIYPTGGANNGSTNNWPFYAAPNTNSQNWQNEHMLAVYYNYSNSKLAAERFNNTGNRVEASTVSAPNNQWTHVHVDYLQQSTKVTIWNADGTQIGSTEYASNYNVKDILGQNSILYIGKANWNSGEYFYGYIDEYKIYGRKAPDPNHPQGSVTQEIRVKGVTLYNVNATSSLATPLAGVTYTVYKDGEIYKEYTTQNDFTLSLTGLPAGDYTIRQTAVPEGYLVASQETAFTVSDAADSWTSVGIFYDYRATPDYAPDKTAQVTDYANRIYEVELSAKSGTYDCSVNTGDYFFVVDQSNSMLFPAVLTDTGATVRLTTQNDDCYSNGARFEQALNGKGLPLNQLYYLLTDEANTATVYAVYKANGTWYYQDASYYCQAQSGTLKPNSSNPYRFPDDSAFNDSSGGKLDSTTFVGTLSGDLKNRDNTNFKIYTGSEINRLSYLKYSIKQMVYMLSALGQGNRVTVTTFDHSLESCMTRQLNSQGVNDLVSFVDGIQTDGGTAQNFGLWHLTGQNYSGGNNSGCTQNHFANAQGNRMVILITDGALNAKNKIIDSGASSQEDDLKRAGSEVRNTYGATLVTVALSSQNVTLAQTLLADTNSRGIATPGYAYLVEADALCHNLGNVIMGKDLTMTRIDQNANIIDYISDSFYLVDENGDALNVGDRIRLDGSKCGYWDAGAGTVGHDENGWYVIWQDQTLPANTSWTSPWKGTLRIKAKEDFIGGNSIDTNKNAEIRLLNSKKAVDSVIPLETPTVNVRLLPINQASSQETVFLGDSITEIQAKLQALKEQLQFTKIVENGDAIHNRSEAAETSGLENRSFTLAYAAGALNDSQWVTLLAGNEVCIEYTYDDASNHGAVGYFTLQLTKTGDGSDFADHTASASGEAVEQYVLTVNYTAYRIADGFRSANVHNGANGPGNEVGGSNGTSLEAGKGTLTSINTHIVHVVDGKLTIVKKIDDSLLDTENDQEFVFNLFVADASGIFTETPSRVIPITVENNTREGSVELANLPRGTYKIVEASSEVYDPVSVTIVEADTNCRREQTEAKEMIFEIGTDAEGKNVIEWIDGDGYRQVYSQLTQSFAYAGYQGISFGKAEVLNRKTSFKAELTVEKIWQGIPEKEHKDLQIYVALYQNGSPVLDGNGAVQVLALNKNVNWKAYFEVPLASRDEDVATLGYTVRELSGVTVITADTNTQNPGVVINQKNADGTVVTIKFEAAVSSGLVKIGNNCYQADVSQNGEGDTYGFKVTNSATYSLPETGGWGTHYFTNGGALLMLGAVLLFLSGERRKRERRNREASQA